LPLVNGASASAAGAEEREILAMQEQGEATSGTGAGPGHQAPYERPPFMQRLLDNPFLLLFLGVTLPTVLYLIWGILEIAQIPLSPS
jgi:hypothetical protein